MGPTVISVEGVSVSVNGGVTGAMLASVTAALSAASPLNTASFNGVGSIPAAVPASVNALGITSAAGGLQNIGGYDFVVSTADAATLTGGGAGTAVVGDLTYVGGAGTVLATGGSGVIFSTGNAAMLGVWDGEYTVVATAAQDSIAVDGGNSLVYAVGDRTAVTVGAGSLHGDPSLPAPAAAAVSVALFGNSDSVSLMSGTNAVFGIGGSTRIDASGGSNMVANFSGNDTVNITGGADTVIAIAGQTSVNNTGGALTFVNWAGGSASLAGAGTNRVYAQSGKIDLFTTGPSSVVALGGAATVDGSNAGNTTFYVNDGFLSGDTTLTGGAGNDLFAIWHDASGPAAAAFTITITNWTGGDKLWLGNFAAGDVAAANSQLTGGASEITLSDGLRIVFTGDKPQGIG